MTTNNIPFSRRPRQTEISNPQPDACTLEQPVHASAHSELVHSRSRYSVKRTVIRPSLQFFVTLSIVEEIEDLYQTVYTIIEGLSPVSYLIAKEVSTADCLYHCHLYLELKEKDYLTNIVEFFTVSFGCKLDIQSVRSRKSVLKYISKEDRNLLTNIRPSQLSFLYQLDCYVNSTKVFDLTHPFVVTHWNKYRFIERYHNERRVIIPPWYGYNQYCDVNFSWNMSVAKWFNDWVVNGWYHKKKQLYLFGPPSVGKSSFVYKMLESIPDYYIFRPDIGQFGFQQWRKHYKVVLLEDHKLEDFSSTHLKLFLEGHTFMASVKCGPPIAICCRVPIIIISNDCLQDNVLSARLSTIHAKNPFWTQEEHLLQKISPELHSLISEDEEELSSQPAQ